MGGALILRAKEVDNALVHLDARVDSTALEDLGERLSVAGLLVQSLVEEDHSGNVCIHRGISSEQKLFLKKINL